MGNCRLLNKKQEEIVAIYHCFVADTPVLTTNGLVNIQDIQIGDYVYAMNIDTMQIEECKVLETFKREVEFDTCVLYLNDETIESTDGHKFYEKEKGWTMAKNLKKGDILINSKGEEVELLNVEIKKHETTTTVYNMAIEKHHNYFVGNNSVLAHNYQSSGGSA